jgi:hypothetical protein
VAAPDATPVLEEIMNRLGAFTAVALSVIAAVAVPASAGAEPRTATDMLARAEQIRVEVDARYRGLRVTEASSTDVIESLTLFDDGADPRVVPAANGIYYAICPTRATCPYPGRAARPAGALAPRRVALELAVRTFLETSADLVVVSLPTPRFILLVFERGVIDTETVAEALAEYPAADRSPQLRTVVDTATLPRLYAPFALAPTGSGRDSLLAVPARRSARSTPPHDQRSRGPRR